MVRGFVYVVRCGLGPYTQQGSHTPTRLRRPAEESMAMYPMQLSCSGAAHSSGSLSMYSQLVVLQLRLLELLFALEHFWLPNSQLKALLYVNVVFCVPSGATLHCWFCTREATGTSRVVSRTCTSYAAKSAHSNNEWSHLTQLCIGPE